MILSCTCKSSFQDQVYGVGKRVHNPMKASTDFRCTVCGKINRVSSAEVKETKGVK